MMYKTIIQWLLTDAHKTAQLLWTDDQLRLPFLTDK
jgi:hypothetical protein